MWWEEFAPDGTAVGTARMGKPAHQVTEKKGLMGMIEDWALDGGRSSDFGDLEVHINVEVFRQRMAEQGLPLNSTPE